MSDDAKEKFGGKFFTVEDLMNLSDIEPVNPQKAKEVSHKLAVRLWLPKGALIALLEHNIKVIQAGQVDGEEVEQRHADILIAQRELWIEYMKQVQADEEEVFVGLFPASESGEDFDHEAAIVLLEEDEDDEDGGNVPVAS